MQSMARAGGNTSTASRGVVWQPCSAPLPLHASVCAARRPNPLDATSPAMLRSTVVNEEEGCVRLHLVGGPQDGQTLQADSAPELLIPEGYQISPWPGGEFGIHWRHELNLACPHDSMPESDVHDALGVHWRRYLVLRRQED
ncbi:hypothetical protein JH261_18315 [Xanthomonas campestris pv. incanae]|nr:hypothetical protein JH261_18315 [Xanthomonas campestris pv. incanae]